MANKYPHPLIAGIIATVVGGLILSAIPMLRGFFMEALSRAWAGVVWLWDALKSDYSLPGWAFLILGLLALVGLMVAVAFLYDIFRPQKAPAYREYTEDMFHGVKWRWSWNGNKISNLWCFCPTCDAELIAVKVFRDTNFICEHCPPDSEDYYHHPPRCRVVSVVTGNRDYAIDAAEREILRRIRTGEHGSVSR